MTFGVGEVQGQLVVVLTIKCAVACALGGQSVPHVILDVFSNLSDNVLRCTIVSMIRLHDSGLSDQGWRAMNKAWSMSIPLDCLDTVTLCKSAHLIEWIDTKFVWKILNFEIFCWSLRQYVPQGFDKTSNWRNRIIFLESIHRHILQIWRSVRSVSFQENSISFKKISSLYFISHPQIRNIPGTILLTIEVPKWDSGFWVVKSQLTFFPWLLLSNLLHHICCVFIPPP